MTSVLFLLCSVFIIPLITGTIAVLIEANFAAQKRDKPSALLFHSISDNYAFDQSHTTTGCLCRLLDYTTAQGLRNLTVSQAVSVNPVGETQPQSYVLAFDDGFASVFTTVFPLLTRYGVKASIFPVVNCLGSVSTWDVYAPQNQLTREQVKILADAGHEIGSHTLSHPDLVLLSDKELDRELRDSKTILEQITGKAVESISFPFGSWNERVWRVAQECGYKSAAAYRNHNKAPVAVLPMTGVYAFDSAKDIIEKCSPRQRFSNARTRSLIMPHFAKGTSVWRFRSNYNIFNLCR